MSIDFMPIHKDEDERIDLCWAELIVAVEIAGNGCIQFWTKKWEKIKSWGNGT